MLNVSNQSSASPLRHERCEGESLRKLKGVHLVMRLCCQEFVAVTYEPTCLVRAARAWTRAKASLVLLLIRQHLPSWSSHPLSEEAAYRNPVLADGGPRAKSSSQRPLHTNSYHRHSPKLPTHGEKVFTRRTADPRHPPQSATSGPAGLSPDPMQRSSSGPSRVRGSREGWVSRPD